GPDHAVYVFWWDGTTHPAIMMRKSTDQGVTFGPPVEVTKLNTHLIFGELGLSDSSGNVFRTPCSFQVVANPVTGDLYLPHHDRASGSADPPAIFLIQSTDAAPPCTKPAP